jgi:acylphosphatase
MRLSELNSNSACGLKRLYSIGFRWTGCEEGDEVEGHGTAEHLDDGSLEIEFACRNGDEAVLKAKRETSSTAC